MILGTSNVLNKHIQFFLKLKWNKQTISLTGLTTVEHSLILVEKNKNKKQYHKVKKRSKTS